MLSFPLKQHTFYFLFTISDPVCLNSITFTAIERNKNELTLSISTCNSSDGETLIRLFCW